METTYYVVTAIRLWHTLEFENNLIPLRATLDANNISSVGFMPVFDDYSKALDYADGNPDLIAFARVKK